MRRLLQASSYQVKKKNGVENFNEIQPIRRVFSAYRNGSFQTDPTFKTPITRTNRWSFGQNAKIERTKKTRITKEEGIRWEKNFCKAKILVQERWSREVVQIKVRESENSIFRWTLKVTKTESGKNVASIKRTIKEKRRINQTIWKVNKIKIIKGSSRQVKKIKVKARKKVPTKARIN